MLFAWTFLVASLIAGSTSADSVKDSTRPPLRLGESLNFDVSWAGMVVGHARIELLPTTSDQQAVIRTLAKANKAIQSVYPVRDTVESWIWTNSGLPFRFEKRVNEGSYSATFRTIFDRPAGSARVTGFAKGKPKGDTTIAFPDGTHDLLSGFVWSRFQPLEPGKSAYMPMLDNRKFFPKVEVACLRREVVSVEAGKFSTLVIEPKLHGDALFQAKGKLTIWLTDDARRMPVKMVSKISMGSIRAELTAFK